MASIAEQPASLTDVHDAPASRARLRSRTPRSLTTRSSRWARSPSRRLREPVHAHANRGLPGRDQGPTLWPDTCYQFPIYEPFIVATLGLGLTALRYFKNDRGQSVAERGLETLRVPKRLKGFLGFVAVAGFVHVWFLVGYFVPTTTSR